MAAGKSTVVTGLCLAAAAWAHSGAAQDIEHGVSVLPNVPTHGIVAAPLGVRVEFAQPDVGSPPAEESWNESDLPTMGSPVSAAAAANPLRLGERVVAGQPSGKRGFVFSVSVDRPAAPADAEGLESAPDTQAIARRARDKVPDGLSYFFTERSRVTVTGRSKRFIELYWDLD
jgi:hypothetical protein